MMFFIKVELYIQIIPIVVKRERVDGRRQQLVGNGLVGRPWLT